MFLGCRIAKTPHSATSEGHIIMINSYLFNDSLFLHKQLDIIQYFTHIFTALYSYKYKKKPFIKTQLKIYDGMKKH